LVLIPIEAGARDALAIWDDRCEECHGDSVKFAKKYLWDVDGQLFARIAGKPITLGQITPGLAETP